MPLSFICAFTLFVAATLVHLRRAAAIPMVRRRGGHTYGTPPTPKTKTLRLNLLAKG